MSDEQIKETIDCIDWGQMVTADDYMYMIARAILALRPAVEPMTLEQMADAIEHLCANREIAEILAANSADEYRAIAAKAQGVRDAS